ncbi:SigE family RNA polymerase sigma factor [Klenkia sp. LSe6-5]|uniref:SigE family RNA polymerase sigma factor n=1 Tax=Klenkia sesuvii TaxID=3103137 RepID=A0ABU8DWX4_9ACTN
MRSELEERFGAFVREHADGLLRVAYLITGDHGHAEDVVQTALLRTHDRWRRLGEPDHALAYARRVVVTTAAGRGRKRSNQELVDLPARADQGADDGTERLVEREVMASALRSLPRGMRAVLVLRYFADLSEADTAATLGCSVGNVRAQAARGLARLRDHVTTLSPTGRS